MKRKSPSDQAIEGTVRIINHEKNGTTSCGTGFFYRYQDHIFIVTNKHVLKDAEQIEFKVFTCDENGVPDYQNMETFILKEDDLIHYSYGHNSKDVDIQIISFTKFLLETRLTNEGFYKSQLINNNFYVRSVTEKNICDQKQLENLFAIEDIVFVGYPNGMWDEVNHLPIMRTGTTASLLTKDYNGEPSFLIDASVFPGSSGSPVFILNDGIFSDRTGTYSASRFMFLGVIASTFCRTSTGEIIIAPIPTTTTPIAIFNQMIDLGVVMHARTVVETVKQYLSRFE